MYVSPDVEKEEVLWTILFVIIAYFMTNILMLYKKKERMWTNIIYEDKNQFLIERYSVYVLIISV